VSRSIIRDVEMPAGAGMTRRYGENKKTEI